MSALILHCHQDDIALWCSFSALRHVSKRQPVTAWTLISRSERQPSRGIPHTDTITRCSEDRAAAKILGIDIEFGNYRDDAPNWEAIRARMFELAKQSHSDVYIPAVEEDGHEHHNRIGEIALEIWSNATRVLSYTKRGKSTNGRKVPYEPEWVGLKLRALAEYKSQFQAATGCVEHFIGRSLEEYTL